MDWLLARQGATEKKLAHRHLTPGSLVLAHPDEDAPRARAAVFRP
jgi:hypothetical protein